MTEIIDLWPDKIKVEKIITPFIILRQQATLLGKKTKNIIQGKVYDLRLDSDLRSGFHYTFLIVVPALSDYQYKILDIIYGMSIYPVIINIEEDIWKDIPPRFYDQGARTTTRQIIAKSEDEFIEILRAIFNSTKVMRIISVLLSQSDPSYDPSLKEEEIQQ